MGRKHAGKRNFKMVQERKKEDRLRQMLQKYTEFKTTSEGQNKYTAGRGICAQKGQKPQQDLQTVQTRRRRPEAFYAQMSKIKKQKEQ